MAKKGINVEAQCAELISDARKGEFRKVYLLMGDEPFYPDMVCDALLDTVVAQEARDFDQFVFYGSDTDADTVISAARGFSMFGGRVLVVVKEAQLMKDIEQFSMYCENPLDSTVFVVCLHSATVDKRKSFYKSASKVGVVVESPAVREYEMPRWIQSYYSSRGLSIDPRASQLLAESAGTELSKIAAETDKLLKNLPEGTVTVTIEDVEKNIGVSRQFSIFELTRALSLRNASLALRTASYIGNSAKFAMPMAVSAIFGHFYKILKCEAYIKSNGNADSATRAEILGVNPYFLREYDAAMANYPIGKTMAIISLLNDYDFKGKGGDIGPDTPPGEILMELVTKILNI